MTSQFVSTRDNETCNGQTSFELQNLSINLVSLNNSVLDTVKDWGNINAIQGTGNLEKVKFKTS